MVKPKLIYHKIFNIFQIVPSEILPHLYIGTSLVAKNKKALLDAGITHILVLDGAKPAFPEVTNQIKTSFSGFNTLFEIGVCV